MDFTFNEDQLLFQESVHDFLKAEVTPEFIRGLWETDTGRSDELWEKLAELGLTGLTVPEEFGGLGMSELDFVLLAQECGYVALPDALIQTVLIAVPLLLKANNESINNYWLPKIAEGSARVAVGIEENLLVEDAHVANLLILEKAGALYAVEQSEVTLEYNPSVDLSRKLYKVSFDERNAVVLSDDSNQVAELVEAAFNRGALGAAAQSLGLAQRMIEISVQYTADRKQFGVALGTFQAVKHHMANIAYRLEYAKAPLARAAYALAHDLSTQSVNVSHAKIVATEVAQIAAQNCIQVHGAMGYTWEVDLHIFMKKAWALNQTWGRPAVHKNRVANVIFQPDAKLGAGNTFLP